MKLSIIIVSWNVKKDLAQCLDSIRTNQTNHEHEIIVVDNASSDGTVEMVSQNYPKVRLIANQQNTGFGAANNQGVKISQGHYLLFLNPDTIVHAEALDTLIDFMDDNTNVGICSPKLLNSDGTTQGSIRSFPTFRAILYRHTIFRQLGIFRKDYKKWMMRDFAYDLISDVDQPAGAALMTRASALKQVDDNGFDENFFMYFEEVDLCYRIKQAGWRIVFIPTSQITHLGGRSAEQIPSHIRMMMLQSMFIFFKKHRSKGSNLAFKFILKPTAILRDMINIIIGSATYIVTLLTLDKKRRKKAAGKIRNATGFLAKYSFELLFKT